MNPTILITHTAKALDVQIEYPALPTGGTRDTVVRSIGPMAFPKSSKPSVLTVNAEIPPDVAGQLEVESFKLMVAHPCDRNLDGSIDGADLGALLSDPAVDGAEIGRLLGAWGATGAPTCVAQSPSVPRMGSTGGGQFKLAVTGSDPVLVDVDGFVFVTHRITLPPNTSAKVRWLLPLTAKEA